jgi:hypothetical protein
MYANPAANVVRLFLSICLFLIVFSVTQAMAGEVTAALTGTVKDSSGSVIPNAQVTLTNISTNVSRTIRTSGDGSYLFALVPIGTYQVTVEQPGFKKYLQSGIVLDVNQNAKLDIALKVGAASETVEVTGNVSQVDTQGATIGKVETSQRIVNLPLVERDTFQLGKLQAGVFEKDEDDGSGNPFSVSGQRSESLTFLIDGTDNNNFLDNNFVVNPNPDAVGEFKILTNNYTAEFGRTSGGIVNQVIKSGTNGYHGDIFEFFRNDALNANNYFLTQRTVFKRNIFGGTFGGPIRKDKTFFFLSYQGARKNEGQVAPVLEVLSPAERGCGATGTPGCVGTLGDFSALLPGTQLVNPVDGTPYVNNQVPINPIIANYIARFLPLPNAPGTNNFVSSPIGRTQIDQGIVRVDHHISDHDTLSGRYLVDDLRDAFPFRINHGASTGGDVPVGSGFTDARRAQIGSLSYTHIFSPTLINEFIVGANRNASNQATPQDRTTPAQLGFTNVNPDDPAGAAPPVIFTNSFNLGPSPQGPTQLNDVTFQFQDNVSWTKGHHDLKFGADIRRIRNNFNFDFFNNGSYDFTFGNFTGNELADFVGGFPDNYFQFSNAVYGIRQSSYYFYGQDSWKINPRLTLNYGLRYEYNTPQSDPHNEIIAFMPGHQSTLFPSSPPNLGYPGDKGTPNRGLTFPDRNNFAPRFGFAWDIFGNSKLVMRGGAGIFYDIEDGALNLQFGGQPPFGDVVNFFPSTFTAGADPIADPFAQNGTSNPFPFIAGGHLGQFFLPITFAFVVDPHFRTPYSENYNYGFQFQVTKDTLIEADYVGSLGRKLVASAEPNFPDPAILAQQVAVNGAANTDCARHFSGCFDPALPNQTPAQAALDPNALPTTFTQLFTNLSIGTSESHEFQLTVDKRFSRGFNLRGAYTVSKTIDNSSGFRARSSTFTDPVNYGFDRGLADFDVPQRLVISGIWELPWDAPFHGFLKKALGGWQLSGIASFQSGTPFTLFSNSNSSQQQNFLDRADLVGPIQKLDPRQVSQAGFTAPGSGVGPGSCLSGTQVGAFFFNPMSFDCGGVPLLSFGNSGRNKLRGPGINNFDFSIQKKFKVTEGSSVQFLTQFFNAFNHAQFFNPNAQGGSGTFGQITQARDPRIIQFGLKYVF